MSSSVTPASNAACSTAIEWLSLRSGSVDRRMHPSAIGRGFIGAIILPDSAPAANGRLADAVCCVRSPAAQPPAGGSGQE